MAPRKKSRLQTWDGSQKKWLEHIIQRKIDENFKELNSEDIDTRLDPNTDMTLRQRLKSDYQNLATGTADFGIGSSYYHDLQRIYQCRTMEIEVRGVAGHVCRATVEPSWKVRDLKKIIAETAGIKFHAQSLCAGGHPLSSQEKLAGFGSIFTCVRRSVDVVRWLEYVDKQCVCECNANYREAFQTAPAAVKCDYDVMCTMALGDLNYLADASPDLLSNRAFMLCLAQFKPEAVSWASQTLLEDRSFILAALQFNRHALRFASKGLRENQEFVREASLRDPWALGDAGENVLADSEFVDSLNAEMRRHYIQEVLRSNGGALRRASDLRSDRGTVLVAVHNESSALEWASPDLQQDQTIIQAARGLNRETQNIKVNCNPCFPMSQGILLKVN